MAPVIGLAYPKIHKRIQKKCLVIYINMAGYIVKRVGIL